MPCYCTNHDKVNFSTLQMNLALESLAPSRKKKRRKSNESGDRTLSLSPSLSFLPSRGRQEHQSVPIRHLWFSFCGAPPQLAPCTEQFGEHCPFERPLQSGDGHLAQIGACPAQVGTELPLGRQGGMTIELSREKRSLSSLAQFQNPTLPPQPPERLRYFDPRSELPPVRPR